MQVPSPRAQIRPDALPQNARPHGGPYTRAIEIACGMCHMREYTALRKHTHPLKPPSSQH